jgi:predicted outer membrane repeat protein
MRLSSVGLAAFGLALAAACGNGSGNNGGSAGDSGAGSSSGSASSSGSSSGTGSSSGASSGSSGGSSGGSGSSSGTTPITDAGAFPPAGNTTGSCKTLTLPSEAQLVDVSTPTTVVGTGTAASCTFAALNTAVSKGGIITFNCGSASATIPVTATLTPPISTSGAAVHVVIDGGNLVTLDGQGSIRIMSWLHATWRTSMDTLTLQRIRLINGKTTPTQKIPACPASGSISNTMCSTGYDDGQGGALYMTDGNLRVIDSIFENNQAALLGPDTGGGAIYMSGTGTPSYIVQSSFLNNTASNAGGFGMLWAGAFVFNSLFQGNSAVGTGANDNSATECTCNNGNNDNQTGSGGNGGALYKDGGDGVNLTICGTEIKGNIANEFGPAVFLTADGSNAQLVIDDSTITGNSTPISYWQWCTDVSTDNPHAAGSTTGSPSPIDTTFCNSSGAACTMTCSS